MTKSNYIVAVLLIACLCGCGVNKLPMDDAYHIPSAATVAETTTTPSTPSSSPQETQPIIEYTNVQDTTITVVIKRK